MAGLTVGYIQKVAAKFGFTDSVGGKSCEELTSGVLISVRKPDNIKVLDILMTHGSLYISSARTVWDDTPVDDILLTGEVYSFDQLDEALSFFNENWDLEEPSDEELITEARTEINRRRGQEKYRKALVNLWGGKCALTGISNPDLLVASHAKPWDVASSSERLDKYNGFLFEARFDKLFDQGYISFDDEGNIIISECLDVETTRKLGLSQTMKLRSIFPENRKYLSYHRENILKHF